MVKVPLSKLSCRKAKGKYHAGKCQLTKLESVGIVAGLLVGGAVMGVSQIFDKIRGA